MGVLPVEAEMDTLWEEGDACRIAIDTIETDGCVARRIAQEVNTLIRVG